MQIYVIENMHKYAKKHANNVQKYAVPNNYASYIKI